MRTAIAVLAITVAVTTPIWVQAAEKAHVWGEMNVPQFEPAFEGQFRAPIKVSDYELRTEVFVDGLVHPWAIETLPDGSFLVTERSGNLRRVTAEGEVTEPIDGVPEVLNRRQGGLLDVKLATDFTETRMIYLTYSKPVGEGKSVTAAGRGTLSSDFSRIENFEDIFVQEPPSPSPMHYGSRIVFDGSDRAFITTGEHFTSAERQYAQDLDKTYGKVIRVNLDGSVPEDNPFAGRDDAIGTIWSFGHRNIQGAAMRDGVLWTIEHGPQGGDELNIPKSGGNYGWPVVSYGRRYDGMGGDLIGSGEPRQPGMEEPVYYWDPVIAPGGMVFYKGDEFAEWNGDLLIGALVAGGLVRLELSGERVVAEERLVPEVGRTRDVEVLEDGSLLIATDFDNGQLIRVTAYKSP